MKLSEFRIGERFFCNGNKWICTDVGTRIIAAVAAGDKAEDDLSWNGPLYALAEHVFDEIDQGACSHENQSDTERP